jgi:hypothetical protein
MHSTARCLLVIVVQGTMAMSKVAPMNRNDNFTKLMSDINKTTDDQ